MSASTLWLQRPSFHAWELESFPHERMDLHISYFIFSPERASEQPPSSVVNTNVSMPCLLHSKARNPPSPPSGWSLPGSWASFPGGEKAESGNKFPWHLSAQDYQTHVLNFSHYLLLIIMTAKRTQSFLISTCIINKVNAPLWSCRKAPVAVLRLRERCFDSVSWIAVVERFSIPKD